MIDKSRSCSQCDEESAYKCDGCNHYFCMRDLTIHRQLLAEEIQNLKKEQQKLLTEVSESDNFKAIEDSLVVELQEWHDVVFEKIRQASFNIYEEIYQLFVSNISKVKAGLILWEKEIPSAIDSDTNLDEHIATLRAKLHQFRNDFENSVKPSSITINFDRFTHIDWNNIIRIEQKLDISKAQVKCLSAGLKCPWQGTKNELKQHIKICDFEPLRLKIEELNAHNKKLIEEINECYEVIDHNEIKIARQKRKLEKYETQIEKQLTQIKAFQYRSKLQRTEDKLSNLRTTSTSYNGSGKTTPQNYPIAVRQHNNYDPRTAMEYTKDSYYVYYKGRPIEGADVKSFIWFLGSSYARDKHNLYYMGQRITGMNFFS